MQTATRSGGRCTRSKKRWTPLIDQAFLPLETIQRQMELFGTKIMPGVLDWLAEPDRVAMVRKGGAIATATLEAKASTR